MELLVRGLALLCIVLMALRVFMFFKATNPEAGPGRVLANQVARYYSIKYLLPISYKKTGKIDIARAKKANLILYIFYIAFAMFFLSIIISY